jgi:hypothetical protein
MTTDDGEYALRNRYGWGGRDRVNVDPSPAPEPPAVAEPPAVDPGESDDD